MLDAELLEYEGEKAIMAHDYFHELSKYVTYPLLRIRDEHVWARPERGVPASTVAVPTDGADEHSPVLMAKDETAHRLVTSGELENP